MKRQALVLVFAGLSAGAVLALDPGQPPVVPAAAVPEPVSAPRGWLSVADPGCVAGADQGTHTDWPEEDRAVHSLTVWLNSRESIPGGPVDVDVQAPRITAWIPIQVQPVKEGEPVPTCLRPVGLALSVDPVPRADYEWNLQRGARPALPSGPDADAETGPASRD